MAEYSRLAKGSFTAASGQTNAIIDLPFQPEIIEVWNLTNIGNAAVAGNITYAIWDNMIPPFTPSGKSASSTMVQVYATVTGGVAINWDTIYTNGVTGGTAPAAGIQTFSGGLALQYGPTQQIIGITKANPAVFNVTAHGYAVGDTVLVQGVAVATTNNMQLLNAVPFTISAVTDANHFTVKWDASGSNYTAISGSPAGALVKKVLYPFLYLPEDNFVSAVTLGNTTTITTTMYHNFYLGQEIAFRVPPIWGPFQLNALPNVLIPGQPMYGYVVSITDNWTFVVNINSSAFTAFTDNFAMTAATLPGLTYMQVLSVGDVNTGGESIIAGGPLYQPPLFPTFSNRVATINGPAIRGSFVNNTAQGFIIGNGTPQQQGGTGTIVTSGAEILWRAFLHDYARP